MAVTIAVLFFITTFLAAATAVLIAAFIQSRLRARRDAQPEMSYDNGEEPVLLSDPRHSSISFMEVLLKKLNVIQHLNRILDDAGLRWSVGRVAAMMLLLGSIGAALVMDLRWLPPGSSLAAFAVGVNLPYMYLSKQRQRRMDLFRKPVSRRIGEPCACHARRTSVAGRD